MMTNLARREFLKKISQYTALGTAGPMMVSLGSLAQASSFSATDYKAVVCVYLYGGNDYANTLVPYDEASYGTYSSLRSSIALPQSSLKNTVLTPAQALSDGIQFALEPGLAPLLPFFANNQMDVLLNIGSLIEPTTPAQYFAKSVALPPHLFSHVDQQRYSQSLTKLQSDTGWLGRIEDLIMSANNDSRSSIFSAVSTTGNTLLMNGNSVNQYQVGVNGALAINALNGKAFGSSAVSAAFKSIITTNQNQILCDQITSTVNRSISAQTALTSALGSKSPFSFFPTGNTLADQLQIVARIIKANQSLSTKRQVFFVALGGFDTHDHITTAHPPLMTLVGKALQAFLTAMDNLKLSQNVFTFTSSDFGRTLTSNGDGSDHGWGSHHFAFGGPIKSSKFIGKAPVLANKGPDDVGQGRLVPTTAFDQLAYAIGDWMGASSTDLATVIPNSSNFQPITL